MKRMGVTGSKGKLGSLLVGLPNFVSLDCDITDKSEIETAVAMIGRDLDVIVNCAGMSSIDACEKNEKLAYNVNVRGLSNLHETFGSRVLNISSDNVFSGRAYFLPSEDSDRSPVNYYGMTKLAAEAVSHINQGKTIRLSRTISLEDLDIRDYLARVAGGFTVEVPDFIYRNYLTRYQAVEGIAYFAENFDSMHHVVNYGSADNVSMFEMVWKLASKMGSNYELVMKRNSRVHGLVPRPERGGFRTSLAKKLGFPMYNLNEVINAVVEAK